MKATEQYFPVVLFIMLYKVILFFGSVDEILSVTIQMKATEQYFPVVRFIMLYKVILFFGSVDKILKLDHLNESYWALLFRGAVCYAGQGGSNFWVCGWNPKVWPFKWKLLSSISCSTVCYATQGRLNALVWPFKLLSSIFFCGTVKVVSTFESTEEPEMRKIKWKLEQHLSKAKYDHSQESYWAVLSCPAVYYVVRWNLAFASVD